MVLFQSQRLLVKPYTIADAGIFFQLNGDAEVMKYIRPAKTKEQSDIFLQENLEFYQQHPGLGRFAIFTKEEQQFIGSFSLLPLESTNNYHLGYALLTPFQGKGFATELVRASLEYVFSTIRQEKIMAITLPANNPSQKILLNCGFVQTGKMSQEEQEVLVFELRKINE
jgi:[ribosomal protein S5]-alanine N-acetyltransferase